MNKRNWLPLAALLSLCVGGIAVSAGWQKLPFGAGLEFTPSKVHITVGTGAPTRSEPKGSLYLRKDAADADTALYYNPNGNTSWSAVQTANPTFTSVTASTEITGRHLVLSGGTALATSDFALTGWGASAATTATFTYQGTPTNTSALTYILHYAIIG
jgi:hypothetical protein